MKKGKVIQRFHILLNNARLIAILPYICPHVLSCIIIDYFTRGNEEIYFIFLIFDP